MDLRTLMLTRAELIGNFSCVDGCVVLNRHLQLRGFGSEIKITDVDLEKSPRRFKDLKTGKVLKGSKFLGGIGGTRHKSAARLCKLHAGVVVIVVSQDGELRVFSSNKNSVNGFGPIVTSY
jgi:hypothetical protein